MGSEPEKLRAERLSHLGPLEAVEDFYARGWTDGLPIVPPTPERVAEFLEQARLQPEEELGHIPTRDLVVTAEDVAINAVMAGCLPEYMRVVAAAVRAQLSETYNAHAVTGTLSGAADVLLVNGPIRAELGVNCTDGLFGPGFRANATIGRALRLLIRNVYGSRPGFLDRASFSQPARYTCCIGENEEDSPWTPLHAQRGLPAASSAVTVFALMDIVKVLAHVERDVEQILDKFAFEVRVAFYYQNPSIFADKCCLLMVIGGYHGRVFREAGLSKADLQELVKILNDELDCLTVTKREVVRAMDLQWRNVGSEARFGAYLEGCH